MSTAFDLHLFASTFALVFVAEWPDKTAFATLVMATQKHPLAVFVGVALAFLVQTAVAVLFGSALALLPAHWVRIGAGLLFIAFAIAMWLRKQDHDDDELREFDGKAASFWKTAGSAFVVIFIAEWGDLTQLATATLQAKYRNPWTIFPAALLALWVVTAIAIAIGNRLKDLINPALLQRIAAVAFAIVGVIMLI